MMSIDANTLRDAAAYVDECSEHAIIHTVTITLNGQHGGADVIIQGFAPDDESINGSQDYERKYEVH